MQIGEYRSNTSRLQLIHTDRNAVSCRMVLCIPDEVSLMCRGEACKQAEADAGATQSRLQLICTDSNACERVRIFVFAR